MPDAAQQGKPKLSLGAIGGYVVGVLGAVFGLWQLQLQREANDRAAGRIAAKLEIVRIEPHPSEFKHLFEAVPSKEGDVPHFRNLNDFLALNPRVRIKNTGDEIIDGMRVETQERFVFCIEPGKAPEALPPWKPMLEPSQREEYTLSEKILPGEEVFVPIAKPLLKSMLQAQGVSKPDWKNFALFEVRCYGRAAGSPTFERAQKDENIQLMYCWYPGAFTEAECKKYVEMTPTVTSTRASKPIGVR